MQNKPNLKTVGLFLLLIAVFLLGTTLSYRATIRIGNSEQWVTHTYAVLGSLESLTRSLQRAQTNANDFIATGKDDYLKTYQHTISLIAPKLDAVAALTADNPDQQKAIADVRVKVLQLQEFLNNAVDYRQHGSFSEPTGEQLQEVVRDIAAMRKRESELLKLRTDEAALNLRTTRVGLLSGAMVNCLLLILGAYLVLRDLEQRSEIKESKLRLAAIVDSSDDAIISKALDGTISTWNAGAERLYEWSAEEMVGRSIYEIVPADRRDELRMILERLGQGERIEHLETYRLRRDGSKIEVELMVSPLKNEQGQVIEASAIGRDITQRKQLERSLHQLSVRILQAQDEERRRIARELHDTTVQKLALLSMNLAQMKRAPNPDLGQATLQSSQTLTMECVQELRTLSYVLHPPMLDELGLASALKIYVEGIAQRSGIEITAEIEEGWERLSPEVEIALFRVAQEGLGNVLRHSGSKTARIQLSNHDGIAMKVIDQGSGMSQVPNTADLLAAVGVGIAGMNERMKQLGGQLTIDSGPGGTTLMARIPKRGVAHA